MTMTSPSTRAADAEIEIPTSGVAWAAIIGGAFAMIGVSLILMPLGTAFGLTALSPWHPSMDASKALSAAGAIWLIVAQWISSGLGGYLTGRLRTKWAGAHAHEVFFRDTVHGFLAWALTAVFSLVLLMSLLTHLNSFSDHRGSPDDREGMQTGTYYTDMLFRSAQDMANLSESDRRQATHILAEASTSANDMKDEDRTYLVQIVSSHTGLSSADAQTRVEDVIARQKAAMDSLHKHMAEFSLMTCAAMLIGAFIASAAAALGGHDRDLHYSTGRFTL